MDQIELPGTEAAKPDYKDFPKASLPCHWTIAATAGGVSATHDAGYVFEGTVAQFNQLMADNK